MRKIIFGILFLIPGYQKAADLSSVEGTVISLFVSTDMRDWESVKASFASNVLLDYSSMTGNQASTMTPEQIIESWKGILPGFSSTHHQLGNFISSQNGKNAKVHCYGTASHFLEDPEGNLWIVVGSYDFDLVKDASGKWVITSMKFNFKYQDGNTGLPQKAMEKLK